MTFGHGNGLNLRLRANHCRSCHADMAWATTKNGQAMPVDVDPDNDSGTVALGLRRDGALIAVTFNHDDAAVLRNAGFDLHTCHFATCPHAELHRRPR